jgi:propionate CoA-transferase
LPLHDRFKYNPEKNIFFVNLEAYFVKTSEDIREMEELAMSILKPLNKKVFGIVNYDNFTISPDLVDEYSDMVKRLSSYYSGVSRYTTSTFLRMKLGEALEQREVAPHIYENSEEAQNALGI